MEPWEALDLDDSDIRSLLRPCKRRDSEKSQFSSDSPSALAFSSQQFSPALSGPVDNQPPPSRCVIPGPAGAMQAAMHRSSGRRKEDASKDRQVEISTQDYVRSVEEDGAEEFASDRWLSAMDFLRQLGVTRTTSLNDIKKRANNEKIDMVVAVIKSCTPNGLGGIMAVVEDPTDSIHASVHRKVVTEGGYGREIAVGSVLVLQKVSVFSPSGKSFYLNISLSNVVKIIPKESGRRTYSACTTEDAVPDGHQNLDKPEPAALGPKRTGKTFAGIQMNFNSNGSSSIEKHLGAGNSELGSQTMAEQNVNAYASFQPRFMRANVESDNRKETTVVDLVSLSQQVGAHQTKRQKISSSTQPAADLTDGSAFEEPNDVNHFAATGFQKQTLVEEERCRILVDDHHPGQENVARTKCQAKNNETGVDSLDDGAGEANGFEKEKFMAQTKASFHEWTDEQLDILDMDDC